MPRKCINKMDNFCLSVWWCDVCRPKKSPIILLFWYEIWWRGQNMGTSHLLQFLCCFSKWMAPQKRMFNAFCIPMIWRELINHAEDCYFCMVTLVKKEYQKRTNWVFSTLTFCELSDRYHMGTICPYPTFQRSTVCTQMKTKTAVRRRHHIKELEHCMILTLGEPHRITHEEVSDLIQDLNLPKDKAELLGSRQTVEYSRSEC